MAVAYRRMAKKLNHSNPLRAPDGLAFPLPSQIQWWSALEENSAIVLRDTLASPQKMPTPTRQKMRFELEPHHRDTPDDILIADLRRVAAEAGSSSVTIDQYNERGRYHATTLTRRFGSWFKALELAGLPRTRNLNIPDEALFENLVEVWTKLGSQPKYNQLTKDVSRYSSGTYEKRFGTWRRALEAFVSWANEGVTPPAEAAPPNTIRRTPRAANWRQRAIVLMRDGATCRLCGATPQSGARLHVDHIVPWSLGGETVIENLQILCEQCNVGKSNIQA